MPITHPIIEDFLRNVVRAICRKTPDPQVTRSTEAKKIVISVNARDQGRIIGRGGIVFWALETLNWFACLAHAMEPVRLELVKHPNNKPPEKPFEINPNWNQQAITDLLDSINQSCLKGRMKFHVEHGEKPGNATVHVEVEKNLQPAMSDPSFEDAVRAVVHAAGMSNGAIIETEFAWR